MTDIYDHPLTMIDGRETTFGEFRGKTVLVVNVASRCGFTPQYAGLQSLYETFGDDGLVVLGLPCNQFMNQEPGTDDEIESFCQANYGVTFPLTAKVDVRGKHQHPLYAELTKFKRGMLPGLVKWNFEKFLVGADGTVRNRFASNVEPNADEITGAVERALATARAV